MSFAVIGWQSSAFTSWNCSWGGSEEILPHVGFYVMAMFCSVCHWVEMGQEKKVQNEKNEKTHSKAEKPHIVLHSTIHSWISRGIKKPWQINHRQAGTPLPQLTDIFHGRFANKVWSQRQAWDPLGNACGITKEEQEAWERACTQMFPAVNSSNT